MRWTRRLRGLFRREQVNRDIDSELLFHVDERVDELMAEGLDEGEARRRALVQFGSLVQHKEELHQIDLFARLEILLRDLRFALRTLAGSPAFTVTAVLSLALGIGANTAIFSIINAVMLRSLPVADPSALVVIQSKEIGSSLTNPIWEQMRDHQQVFSGMLAFGSDRFDLAQSGESHFANGLWVSGDFFRVLGVPALRGRVFTSQEDRRGTPPVAVISYAFAKRHFPDEPNVIGKTVPLNRHAFVVVGVTPPWFDGLDVDTKYDVAIPIACEPILSTDASKLEGRSYWWLRILGRLKAGESQQQAEAGLQAITPAILRSTVSSEWRVDEQKDFLKASFQLAPAGTGFSDVRLQYGTALFALMAAAALVLLITCANVANLLLARASARQREFAVRLALGASRVRLMAQLLTESLVLALAGAAAGLVLAVAGSRLLVQLISTAGNPLMVDLSPDIHLLTFSIGAAITTAVLFGLVPAFQATRGDLNHGLKENARGAVPGGSKLRLRGALVAAQVALSFVLLVAAGLFLGTLNNVLHTDLGFERHNVLLANVRFQENAVPKERRMGAAAEIVRRLRSVPGVVSAASSLRTPVSNFGWNELTHPEDYRPKSRMDTVMWLNRVSPGYFSTMNAPLLSGRDFRETDGPKAPKVMIIGESAARHFFHSANPLGKTIGLDEPASNGKQDLYEVIGIVEDSKYQFVTETTRFTGFVASGQDTDPGPAVTMEVRYAGRTAPLEAIRSAIVSVNPNVSLEFRQLDTQVRDSMIEPRVLALLSSIFGFLALLLAAVGLYGVTAFGMAQRRSEIGIRIALGARRWSVIRMALTGVARLLAIGIIVGCAGSLLLGGLVQKLLYGVQANDPRQVAAAAAILLVCGLTAAYLPARRAANLNPLDALREE